MKSATLNKYDDVLTADERFRLALAAMARGDEGEVERLKAACPRFTYTMPDHEFAERWQASHTACLFFAAWWQWNATRYHAARLMAYECRQGRVPPDMSEEAVLNTVETHLECLKGVWFGFVRFCAAIRVEPDDLMEWWPPIRFEVMRDRTLLDYDIFEPDAEMEEATYHMLAVRWPGLRETLPERDHPITGP